MSEYKKSNSKIKLMHNTCGRTYITTPNNFLSNGSRCTECVRESEYINKINKITNNKFKQLTQYKTMQDNITFECKTCGDIITKKAEIFANNPICPQCTTKLNTYMKHRENVRKLYDKFGSDISIISFNGNDEELVKCNICGNVETRNIKVVINSVYGCKQCAIEHSKTILLKPHEQFVNEIEDLNNGKYDLLEKYRGVRHKHKFIHNECGNVFYMRANDFLHGQRCPECWKIRKTTEEFKQELNSKYGDEYELLSEYNGTSKPIFVKHKCGYKFKARPNYLLSKKVCPYCLSTYQSKGSRMVIEYLFHNNINHSIEYQFEDLRGVNNGLLRYDTSVLDDNDKLIGLIEFHGEQHYRPVERYGGIKDFIIRKIHDKMKENYCNENNIPLLIIPYSEENIINKKVEEFLKEIEYIH